MWYYWMKFKALYPDSDKSDLIIEEWEKDSVRFSFKVLPEYVWRIGVTLSTTIGWFHSWWETMNSEIKKHLGEIAKITDGNNDVIYKDSDNILKIMKSYGSDDITISNRFSKPKQLPENVEIIVDQNNCNPEIMERLFSILSLEKDFSDSFGRY